MSVPRQQPHAIAKFKHQARTAVPKPVTVPAHMAPYDAWYGGDWASWFDLSDRKCSDAERKRCKARAKRKSRK